MQSRFAQFNSLTMGHLCVERQQSCQIINSMIAVYCLNRTAGNKNRDFGRREVSMFHFVMGIREIRHGIPLVGFTRS